VIPQPLVWRIARGYARAHQAARRAGFRLRGLGWMLRRVRTDHVLHVNGVKLHFDHRIAASYDHLVMGELNEPETSLFLRAVLDACARDVTFVDVGANVGEFLITMAEHPRVRRAIGFEPIALCAEACERSIALNGFGHVSVRRALVGDGSIQRFAADPRSPNASSIGEMGDQMETTRLDQELRGVDGPLIVLIDVEGAEPLVLAGAREVIGRTRPLIVFEYNDQSRQHYRLDRVKELLGPGYVVHRLRPDGTLDARVEESWNCVAVPMATLFEGACAAQVR
jgi:FkbM family methyltransferase